jgi:hypothetical protein
MIQTADTQITSWFGISPKFGKPISSTIFLHGKGEYYRDTLEAMQQAIVTSLIEQGHEVCNYNYGGLFSAENGIEVFDDSKRTLAHEEVHQKHHDAGCASVHEQGYHMLCEGAATARADWMWPDASRIEILRALGPKLRDLYHRVNTSDPQPDHHSEMLDLIEMRAPPSSVPRSWATLLVMFEYYGLYDVCMDVFDKNPPDATDLIIEPMMTAEKEGLIKGVTHLAKLAKRNVKDVLKGIYHIRSNEYRTISFPVFRAENHTSTFDLHVATRDLSIAECVKNAYMRHHNNLAYHDRTLRFIDCTHYLE